MAIERGSPLPTPWPAEVLDGGNRRGAGAHATPISRRPRVVACASSAGRCVPRAHNAASLIVVSDRTAERTREASERRFLANASHELRTPLAAIVAAVEVLEGGAKDDVEARDTFLADLQREAHRLQRLTERLLTVARMGSGALQPALQAVAARAASRAHRRAHAAAGRIGRRIDLRPAATGPRWPIPTSSIRCSSGSSAMRSSTRRAAASSGSRPTDGDDGLQVAVADTGSGIPRDNLAHVFDRFWRGDDARRAGGFGLGLGICREFVEAMGGEISIDSQPGRGTTVEIIALVNARARTAAGDSGLMAARILHRRRRGSARARRPLRARAGGL